MQQRQAELESSQSHLESLTNQVTELQHQLRERDDRIGMLSEELSTSLDRAGSSTPGGQSEATFLVAEVESKYEARIADLRERMRILDKERADAEEEWAKNMQERSRDVDRLRAQLGEKEREHREEVTNRAEREEKVGRLEERLKVVLEEKAATVREAQNAKATAERAKQAEVSPLSVLIFFFVKTCPSIHQRRFQRMKHKLKHRSMQRILRCSWRSCEIGRCSFGCRTRCVAAFLL